MEFPDDVLTIIREYARPRMQYIHEYNEMARLLGVEFPKVKKKLETKDADHVMEQFVRYTDAVVKTRDANAAIPAMGHTASDHMKWVIASRNYSAHLEVTQLRLRFLEWLLL
jgi:hypothetical protein